MRHFNYFFYFCIFMLSNFPVGQTKNLLPEQPLTWQTLPLKNSIIQKIKNGEQYSLAEVDSIEETQKQSMDVRAAAWHPRSCQVALPYIANYENYKSYLDFVEESKYSEETEIIYLLLSSAFLPAKMELIFKLPRIKQVGHYPFFFEKGFLKGLTGTIRVGEVDDRCLFFVEAKWLGAKTSFPNVVMETFSQMLVQLGMSKLIKISSP